jgi:hypothetical protein
MTKQIREAICKCGGTIILDDFTLTASHSVPECEMFIELNNTAKETYTATRGSDGKLRRTKGTT